MFWLAVVLLFLFFVGMGSPCFSSSHVLALDLVGFVVWVVFLFVLG
jgi:hypothetical protein